MSKSICKFNKFGICKYGNHCFRNHENVICKNAQCSISDCHLRHPRKCKYFLEFQYCKFGEYCKFSHEIPLRKETSKEIDTMKQQIKLLENEIQLKENLIKEKDLEIHAIKEKYEKALEKQASEDLKEIERIRNDLHVTQMLFDDFKEDMTYKYGYDSSAETSDEELNFGENNRDKENDCTLCNFKGKTAAGLKTHTTRKHGGKEL